MKESHRKGIANHPDPESCASHREVTGEALTGAHTGGPLSSEKPTIGRPTLLTVAEGNIPGIDSREMPGTPAESSTPSTCGNSSHGNREIPQPPPADGRKGRSGKGDSPKPDTHGCGKSDSRIVPKKPPNKVSPADTAEGVEGRRLAKGNASQTAANRTQSRGSASIVLARVREVARRNRRARFTALLHHVTEAQLQASYYALKRNAAAGVDEVTWRQYEGSLSESLPKLHEQVHLGSYRAKPSKRAYVPKGDGRQRPLGIASLEDKIVQHSVATVLNQIYEADFKGFSYGFRPGRSQHQALDALTVGLMRKKVNWVLDADIQGYFDTINHGWLEKFVEHRIADRRILRLIRKWLRAGVSEEGEWSKTEVGTPQGSVISPLLANVFLHYVFDLWVDWWRQHKATGDVIVVRYADDFVVGFQHRAEAERFHEALQGRMGQFGLRLHPTKTRLIEFGRYAARDRKRRGKGKPQTFDFLGFTHICGQTRRTGKYMVRRQTIRKRLRSKLQVIKRRLHKHRHATLREQGGWVRSVVQGYYNYHGIPGNIESLKLFSRLIARYWLRALRRRSQRHRLPWRRFVKILRQWMPQPRILHPQPGTRFDVRHPRQEPSAVVPHAGIWAGGRP